MKDVHRAGVIIGILGELDRSGLLNRDVRNVLGLSLPETLARYDIMVTDDAVVKSMYTVGPVGIRTTQAFSQECRWMTIVKKAAFAPVNSPIARTDDFRALRCVGAGGNEKYVQLHGIRDERLAHVLSGANVNFHCIRHVSERCELGEQREALMAVTIPERKDSFLAFCELLGGRPVTEFNYRYSDADNACIFVGVRLTSGREEILAEMAAGGYQVADEMAKLYVRYMVGGRPSKPLRERFIQLRVSRSPRRALLKFLYTLGTRWNITLFHYRSHGTDYGRVLAGFELVEREPELDHYLSALGYECHDVTANPAFRLFPANNVLSEWRIGRQRRLALQQLPEGVDQRLL